jgi:hypothetical protein
MCASGRRCQCTACLNDVERGGGDDDDDVDADGDADVSSTCDDAEFEFDAERDKNVDADDEADAEADAEDDDDVDRGGGGDDDDVVVVDVWRSGSSLSSCAEPAQRTVRTPSLLMTIAWPDVRSFMCRPRCFRFVFV